MSSEGNEGEGCCFKETKFAQASNQGFGDEGTKKKELVLVNPKSQRIKYSKTVEKHKQRPCQRFEKDSSRKDDISQFDT